MSNNLLIIILGILANSAGIAFNFYYLNIIGGILILIGLIRTKLTGNLIKKTRNTAIASIPFAILSVIIDIFGKNTSDGASIALGINIFFYIYVTYYFTEALIASAKDVNELAATRGFRGTWTLCGIIAFMYFMTFSALVPSVVMIIKIVMMIAAIYYCSTINASSKLLFKNN